MPDLRLERELIESGTEPVAGIDEAGRGPLAGPVAAAAVIRPNAPARTWALASREHKPYPAVVDGEAGERAVLLVKDWEHGPERVVPRSSWRFAREADQTGSAGEIVFSGPVVPSKESSTRVAS